ncbi:hypothetical protein GN958_ATG14374 [Phytophthora infestans]|uniref:Uncharacterized protein n=1 Tax=Phytophthora infestans TaxID=4787 RepID=A0A8S9UDM2_PHYIN|nr:hypothetical protein GN958_ATG14374 [Phytophthora infestans]
MLKMETTEEAFALATGAVKHSRLATSKVAPLARTLGGVLTRKAQYFCLALHPSVLVLESQPGTPRSCRFIGHANTVPSKA